MPVAAAPHLRYLELMPLEQRLEPAPPAQGLGMAGVALFSLRDHDPDSVELTVLTQEMVPAQEPWRDVPDAHV